jgi:hypothetical protein
MLTQEQIEQVLRDNLNESAFSTWLGQHRLRDTCWDGKDPERCPLACFVRSFVGQGLDILVTYETCTVYNTTAEVWVVMALPEWAQGFSEWACKQMRVFNRMVSVSDCRKELCRITAKTLGDALVNAGDIDDTPEMRQNIWRTLAGLQGLPMEA